MSQNQNQAQPSLFACPTCGARLPVPETASVKCEYCGSIVLVPQDVRSMPSTGEVEAQVAKGVEDHAAASVSQRSAIKITLFFIILISVIGIGMLFLVTAGAFITTSTAIYSAEQVSEVLVTVNSLEPTIPLVPTVPPTELPAATPVPFAEQVLQFGDQGTGPGYFQDPREISVDANGNIFVADFNTGRIQKFDPEGKFLQAIQVTPGDNQLVIISDLATDSKGLLYVVRGGDILIYAPGVIEPVIHIKNQFPQTFYEAIAIDAMNNLYALVRSLSSQDLVKIGPNGEELRRVKDIVYGVNPNTPAENRAISVDGLGNTYFLSTFEPQIYKYDTGGNFNDRLGAPGREVNQLQNPDKLVVDGKGRLYVLDTGGIKVFDPSGAFIDLLNWDYSMGSPRDLALDRQGYLYLVTSKGFVVKYKFLW